MKILKTVLSDIRMPVIERYNIASCWMGRLDFVRKAIFCKLHFGFNTIPDKTPEGTDKGPVED